MTRDKFIKKWLGNPDYKYCEESRDEMRDDLDLVIGYGIKNHGVSHHVRLSLPNRKELEERYDDWSKYHVSGIWRDDFKKLVFQFIDRFKSS